MIPPIDCQTFNIKNFYRSEIFYSIFPDFSENLIKKSLFFEIWYNKRFFLIFILHLTRCKK
jgi:hypothetical protein